MPTNKTLLLGAVAYDPKVVTIWDGFKAYFQKCGLPFDYTLYSNYERQVEAQFAGHIHVAWNSPLAWVQTERIAAVLGRRAEAIAMRDADCDLTSIILVRSDSPIRRCRRSEGHARGRGGRGLSSSDADPSRFPEPARGPRSRNRDFEVMRFDKLHAGKHGDHIGGERDAARALIQRRAPTPLVMIDGNHLAVQPGGR